MKASIEWLEEYSDIDVDSVKLGDILTMTGSKVETIEQKGNDIKNVVVGKILEIKKHEDSDHLIVTQVDVGNEKIQIVTGADNVKENDIVTIAKDGSELPGGIKIKKGLLRGVESCGMMCSVGELGLELADYPGQIEHGIMILDKSLEKVLAGNSWKTTRGVSTNLNTYIYGASHLLEIGDMSLCNSTEYSIATATNLRELKIGDEVHPPVVATKLALSEGLPYSNLTKVDLTNVQFSQTVSLN